MEAESYQTRETAKDMQLLETNMTERRSRIPETTTKECPNSTITSECYNHTTIDECQHSKTTNEYPNSMDQTTRGCPNNTLQKTSDHRRIITRQIISQTPSLSRLHRQIPALFLLQFTGNTFVCLFIPNLKFSIINKAI